jgi:hypothetical protein
MTIYNNEKFIILLTVPFDEINIDYSWSNMKLLFEEIYEDLFKNDNISFFIKYNLLKFYFVYYTNYLEFINHKDNLNLDIDKYNDKIKYSENIINKIFKISDNIVVNKIIKNLNPFNFKKNNKNNENTINFIKTCKQYEKIQMVETNSHKKILNLIIYRYLLTKNNKLNNYNDYYLKFLLKKEHYNGTFINIDDFIKIIPNLKMILSLKINTQIKNNFKINYIDIIKYFIKINNNNNDYSIDIISNNSFVLSSKKLGKIIFEKSDNNINEICVFQYNLDLFYFNNNKELKNYNFIKKGKNLFKIKFENYEINNLSSLLNIFYILTKAFKLLEYHISDLYEFMFINQINNYNYYTFVNFFNFINSNITYDSSTQKFIADLIKYLYIYSYYDFYFYNNENLMNTIIDNNGKKNEIFLDFCNSIKVLFKLPNELLLYPPFLNNYLYDNILYYSYDELNYFKFYDLIMAIKTVYDCDEIQIQQGNFSSNDILKIINKSLKIDTPNDNSIDENDKKINKNIFVELNIENSEDYLLETDILETDI